jgi:hypothetical protein
MSIDRAVPPSSATNYCELCVFGTGKHANFCESMGRAFARAHAQGQANEDQNSGRNEGFRLYLTEGGEWLELERAGRWTQWQGSPSYWYTDADSAQAIGILDNESMEPPTGGKIRSMTDAEVAAEYVFADVLSQIGKSMAELCKKLPERYNRLKANAELAQRAVAAIRE